MRPEDEERVITSQNLEELIDTMRNGDFKGVLKSIRELTEMGGKAVGPLLPLLRDEDPKVRWRASIVLQQVEESQQRRT